MKNILFTLALVLCFAATSFGQKSDQNPRAQEAYEQYRPQVQSHMPEEPHSATMGATVDKTYVADDPMEAKAQEKRDRKEFRRELRMERARNRRMMPRRGWGW
jgi:hypothetical protein